MAAVPRARGSISHIAEFDGLRGYLAWWVVAFHLYQSAGLDRLNLKLLALTLGQGWGAVPIFFILSGFVIAMMEDSRQEPYRTFIVRRFFRLAPVYYLILAMGIVDAIRTHEYAPTNLWAHVACHVTMLHGLLPDEVLYQSPHALDYVSWSISVEWQFYLVAPFVLRAIRHSPTKALAVLAGFGVVAYVSNHSRLTFEEGATVFHRAGLFAIGIGSHYVFKYVMTNREDAGKLVAYMLPLGLALAWVCGGPFVWPGPIWIILFSSVVTYHAGVESVVTRPVRVLLGLPVMVWLGRVSYSTYLCHNRVFTFVDEAVLRLMNAPTPMVRSIALLVIGVPLVAAASGALYYLVENPGIQLGKRLAKRLDRRPRPAAIEEAGVLPGKGAG